MQKSLVEYIAKQTNINKTEDWYTVTMNIITKHTGKHLRVKFNTILTWVHIKLYNYN